MSHLSEGNEKQEQLRSAITFTHFFISYPLVGCGRPVGLLGKHANWGNWQNFEDYTIKITSFLPEFLSIFGAYAATFLETAFALLLLVGYKTKLTAVATSILLFLFAFCMSLTLGIKVPLDYSVWVGSAAAFLLSTQDQYQFSFDNKFIN